MSTLMGGFGVPGVGELAQTQHREIMWGSDESKGMALFKSVVISGDSRDAGNTPTTLLRAGLLFGKVDASGKHAQFDADATDGTQNVRGVLTEELLATDFGGTSADRAYRLLLRAPLQASQLLIQGSAFVGHVDEFLARRQLIAAGCVFDDDPNGYLAGEGWRVESKVTNYTIVAADNGKTFFFTTADATATLPAIKAGLEFEFVRASDHELVVASPTADNMIVGNDLSADSVTFTTASEQIGARVKVRSVYLGSTLKWLVELPQAPFGTKAGSQLTIAVAT